MQPVISTRDYAVIMSIIANLPNSEKTKETRQLLVELDKAEKVDILKIPNDIIRLNSFVEIMDMDTEKRSNFELTFPKMASLELKRISILAPLGVALIGFQEGMIIDWVLPGGARKIKILKVINEQTKA